MTIVETTVKIKVKKGIVPDSRLIEDAIRQAGLDVVRWSIIDVRNNEYIISASGIQNT